MQSQITQHLSSGHTYSDLPLKISRKDLSYGNLLKTLQNHSESSSKELLQSSRTINARHLKTTETQFLEQQYQAQGAYFRQQSQSSPEPQQENAYFEIPCQMYHLKTESNHRCQDNQIYSYLVQNQTLSLRERIQARLSKNKRPFQPKNTFNLFKNARQPHFKSNRNEILTEIDRILLSKDVFNAKEATFRPNGQKIFEFADQQCETLRKNAHQRHKSSLNYKNTKSELAGTKKQRDLSKQHLKDSTSCIMKKLVQTNSKRGKQNEQRQSLSKMDFHQRQSLLIKGRENKYDRIREVKKKQEIEQCTFKPRLTLYRK